MDIFKGAGRNPVTGKKKGGLKIHAKLPMSGFVPDLVHISANIYAAAHEVDYQNATFDGPGMNYLWLRVPLQILFIAWAYVFAIKK